jgi:hypothetical protein
MEIHKCKGETVNGSPCKRKCVNPNSYCFQHDSNIHAPNNKVYYLPHLVQDVQNIIYHNMSIDQLISACSVDIKTRKMCATNEFWLYYFNKNNLTPMKNHKTAKSWIMEFKAVQKTNNIIQDFKKNKFHSYYTKINYHYGLLKSLLGNDSLGIEKQLRASGTGKLSKFIEPKIIIEFYKLDGIVPYLNVILVSQGKNNKDKVIVTRGALVVKESHVSTLIFAEYIYRLLYKGIILYLDDSNKRKVVYRRGQSI